MTYGRHHALVAAPSGTPDGMDIEFFTVIEVNEGGQGLYMSQYDPEDEAAAVEDLRLRYLATSDTS